MQVDIALAIINTAREAGALKTPIAETDEGKIDQAQQIVVQAETAWNSGARQTPALRSILSLAQSSLVAPPPPTNQVVEPDPIVDTVPEAAPEPPPDETTPEPSYSQAAPDPDIPADADPLPIGEGAKRAIERVRQAGLPLPPRVVDTDVTPVPRDPTSLSDTDLRRIYNEWGLAHGWANWVVALESADFASVGAMLAFQRKASMATIPRKDADGKPKTVTMLEAEVDTLPEIKDLIDQHARLANSVTSFKALAEIYKSNVDRLSREMSARHNEWQRAHG